MTPFEQDAGAAQSAAVAPAAPRASHPWYSALLAALLITLYLEAGFFLVAFPWTHYARDFAAFRPEWRPYWDHLSVRCSISALGAVNLCIGFLEALRLRKRLRG